MTERKTLLGVVWDRQRMLSSPTPDRRSEMSSATSPRLHQSLSETRAFGGQVETRKRGEDTKIGPQTDARGEAFPPGVLLRVQRTPFTRARGESTSRASKVPLTG